MENLSDNEEDTLEVASKTLIKVIDPASKIGFSDGVEDGSRSVFQENFNKGYKQAFKPVFFLGIYKALANNLLKDIKHPTEIENILSNTKKGICYICKNNINELSEEIENSVTEIEKCQNQHSDEVLKILEDYFMPLLKEKNIDLDFVNFYSR